MDVPQHADALVSPPCRHCPFSNLPFHPFATRPMITSELSHFRRALRPHHPTPGGHSNPIGPRPPRQRLPPSLLIENASDRVLRPCHLSCPRRFRSRLATIRPGGFRDRRVTGVTRSGRQTSHNVTSGQSSGRRPRSAVAQNYLRNGDVTTLKRHIAPRRLGAITLPVRTRDR